MIWIIIPVHNRRDQTLRCLESLYRQTFKEIRIIVVDDGSIDSTSTIVAKEYPDVILLQGSGNLWWTGATNVGIRYVLKIASNDDYILLLNNDTVLPDNYLQAMLNSAKEYPHCLIGSVAIDDRDKSTIVDGGVCINWFTAKFTYLNKGLSYDSVSQILPKSQSVDVLSGRGTLVAVDVFKEIGLFNEDRLPHYNADYEFAARANKSGYNLIIDYNCLLYANIQTTGINNQRKKIITWRDFFRSFHSMRSTNNLKYRWNFAYLACPRLLAPSYFFFDTLRVILGGIKNQLV
jgi:GT2 family glycosyltransferase